MNVDNNTVAILIQGGAVGLALISISGLIYALRMAFNHLAHTGEMLGRVAGVLHVIAQRLEIED